MLPEKVPSLANLPGQNPDGAARERRREFKGLTISEEEIERLLSESFSEDKQERAAESYALSSFAIEALWEHIKREIEKQPLSLEEDKAQGDSVPKRFVAAMNTQLDAYRDSFLDSIKESMSGPELLSKEQTLSIRYLKLMVETEGKLGVPSMRDLVTLMGRMADVISEVFMRDIGRDPNEEELSYALSHPSLKRLFMEMMTNSKPMLMAVFDQIEKDPSKNLDDPTGELKPEYFEIARSEDQREYVRFRPDEMEKMRNIFAQVAVARAEKGAEAPRTLVCPALYTGKFVEMYDWVREEFEKYAREHGLY